ncbi:aldehyde dehydrogenase family 2 member C4-like protein [Tanacetum coccineum]
MTKVIKGEFEKIKDVKVEDVSLTCDTPLEAFNNEVNRLSRMDDDLFTYEVEVANIPCDSKIDDDSEHEADDDMGYDPSDVAFTEWLGLKIFNYKTMDHYTMKALWIYWIRGDDEVELTNEESSDDMGEVAEFVDSVPGTIDPRTEEVIANIAEGDKEDVDLDVKAAREAFDHGPWPRLSGSERGRIMMKFLQLAEENIKELVALDALDADKLFELGKATEIPFAFSVLRYYTSVVGHIIPGNFPIGMFLMKTSLALAAGCTMLVKPAEQSPLSALYLAHLAKLAGIPDGVINVVIEFGETAGAAIGSHMDIDCVSFTGSTEIGRVVMQAAVISNLKAVSLEQCS